jgi:predicted dinucleotide-binding enzyme
MLRKIRGRELKIVLTMSNSCFVRCHFKTGTKLIEEQGASQYVAKISNTSKLVKVKQMLRVKEDG